MRRILIHAGFHKTGTTHLQQTLRANRAALRPDIRLVLRPGMTALCESARAYSKSREDYALGLVKYEAAQLIERLEGESAKTIIISSEDLSGHIPGRHNLHGYGAAPHLMRALSVAFAAASPDDTVAFYFTTRKAEPWLRSCYAQHLRAVRMVWDEDDYVKRMASSADHAAIIDLIRPEVSSHTVTCAQLEDYSNDPLGLAGAVLDHLGFDPARRAALTPSDKRNAALSDTLNAELLALNRSDMPPPELRKAKRALIEGAA